MTELYKRDFEYDTHQVQVEKLFQKHKISYILNSTGHFVFKTCPFCHKLDHLYFTPRNCRWICHKCSEKGNLLSLIVKLERVSLQSALSYLFHDEVRVEVDKLNFLQSKKLVVQEQEKTVDLSSVSYTPVDFPRDFRPFEFTSLDVARYKRFYMYLLKRGITKDMVHYFGVRFSTVQERIIFPVYFKRMLVGWQGRTIHDGVIPKAKTQPKHFEKSSVLMNYDRVWDKEYLTFVEGPIDGCKTYNYNCVPLLGKTLSEVQFSLVRQMPRLKKIYLGLDPEEVKVMKQLYKKLSPFYEVLHLQVELGSDCGDKSVDEIDEYVERSNSFDFFQLPTKSLKLEKYL